MAPRPVLRRASEPFVPIAAGAYAAAEPGLAIALGFFDWGRAELSLFLALRPWLLLLLAAAAAGRAAPSRAAAYALALGLATAAELILLAQLGAAPAWAGAARGLAAGLAVALLLDLGFAAARRRLRIRRWRAAAAVLLGIALLNPLSFRAYEAAALHEPAEETGPRPRLLLMTALPVIWGEGGAFDPSSRPAAAYRALRRDFDVRPLDVADAGTLAQGRLLLLAQPRALAPTELAAVDAWVRAGGRALILQDPALLWPGELPLGDLRRAPPYGLLGPLLTHWGVRVERPDSSAVVVRDVALGGAARRLALAAPGRVEAAGPDCRAVRDFLARCRIGAGAALVLADADLLHDALWVAPGERGDSRARRRSDNVPFVLDLLDRLAGVERARPAVRWQAPEAGRGQAMALAFLPAAASLAAGAALRRRGRR